MKPSIKKLFLFIALFLSPYLYTAYADTIVTWSPSGAFECPTEWSKYWVPAWNSWPNDATSWSRTCYTHNYYSNDDHVVWFTINWWYEGCPAWEQVVSWNAGAHTMTCRKYDDTPPSTPTLTCTNFSDGSWTNAAATTCSINNTAWPSPRNWVQ